MRLADFILRDMAHILAEWESFATTLLPAARNLNSLALRNHAPQILQAVAKDLSTPQKEDDQREKSMGRAPELRGTPETAAQTHALMRARAGFNINQWSQSTGPFVPACCVCGWTREQSRCRHRLRARHPYRRATGSAGRTRDGVLMTVPSPWPGP